MEAAGNVNREKFYQLQDLHRLLATLVVALILQHLVATTMSYVEPHSWPYYTLCVLRVLLDGVACLAGVDWWHGWKKYQNIAYHYTS